MEPIDFDGLMRDLADPEVDEERLKPYLTARPDLRVGLAPVLLPNENVRTVRNDVDLTRVRGEPGWAS